MTDKKDLFVYNTLTGQKELFTPVHQDRVGMYVCGPTVYGEAHLGHARSAITFDIVYRVLKYLGYNVRYVRNFTDVGHLLNDSDDGDDKVEKKAQAENKEPQEVAQYYEMMYLKATDALNCLRPNIMPIASGHIMEQIDVVKILMDKGLAYESEGSVYFDVDKYNREVKPYGILSHRTLEDTMENSRELSGQKEKKNPFDFALWKKAPKEHIMKWPSPWSLGFPGWHLECTAMGRKYLGAEFDIHGGGMDLVFPHHDCEIAQSIGAYGDMPAKYWLHNNMITIEGKKMGKSYNNFITLSEMFSGQHPLLKQAYNPMTIRFFMLMAHYRSTLDFSNDALIAAEKGLARLTEAKAKLKTLKADAQSTSFDAKKIIADALTAVCDDFNTPVMIAHLFELTKHINAVSDGKETITQQDKQYLEENIAMIFDGILGLKEEKSGDDSKVIEGLIDLIMDMRSTARSNKDYATSDKIRDALKPLGIEIKDGKEGASWRIL
ncbi:MAG: cysteine--tRNA ligase [Bacteroidales bacterium]|nr:cysteine--tRNA ligase [Bacteroidales bacterium]